MRSEILKLLVAAVAAMCVVGCGQKGPLYLPDKPSEVVTRPGSAPAQTTAPVPVNAPTAAPGADDTPPKAQSKDKESSPK